MGEIKGILKGLGVVALMIAVGWLMRQCGVIG